MKYIICIVWLFITGTYLPILSQKQINGRVLSSTQEPIPFANILILNLSDSTLIQGGISDFDGLFSIPFNHTKPVFASVSYMGYQASDINIENSVSNIELGTIILKESGIALDEVMVKSRIPLFEQKIDRMVVNVQSSVTNAGNTALNVLNKTPNITINRATGELSLQGKSGVVVMINDKEVRMEGSDLISLLEGMPAANIQEIELITTTPARYDAQGVAGIINLKMMNDVNDGFKGRASVFGGVAELPKYGGSANLNYNKGKIFAYANASANVNLRDPIVVIGSNLDFPNGTVQSLMEAQRRTKTGLYTGEIGVGYRIKPKTEMGLRFSFYNRDYSMNSTAKTIHETAIEQSTEWTYSDELNNMLRSLYNVYINHEFSNQVKLNLDYDFVNVYRDNPTEYHTVKDKETPNEDESFSKSQAETPLNIHVGKGDLEIKLNDNIQIETGLKYTYSGFENKVSVSVLDENIYQAQEEYTRTYTMNENIYAAYASADWKLNTKLLLKGGVRYENYSMYMHSTSDGVVLDYTQSKLFPNVFINYVFNEHHALNGSFAQRIQRPGFLQLAPYFYFFNTNTLFTGNPKLNAANSSQYKINYRFKRLNMGLEYTYTNGPIYIAQPNKDINRQLLIIAPSQGYDSHVYSFSVSVPWKISSKWESNYNLIAYHRNETAKVNNSPYQVFSNNFNFTMNHNYEIINNWILELNYMYNSDFMVGISRFKKYSSLDLGLQHKFKNGAAITVSVSDVFQDSYRWLVNSEVPENGMKYKFRWETPSPIFRVNLSIPLGNKKVKDHQQRNHGSAEELNRL